MFLLILITLIKNNNYIIIFYQICPKKQFYDQLYDLSAYYICVNKDSNANK